VGQSRRLSEYLQHHQLALLSFRTLSGEEEENVELELTVHVGEELSQSELLSDLLGIKGIKQATVTEPKEQKEKD
jgi:putative Mg2+ transporter-C (MgtC) family protein